MGFKANIIGFRFFIMALFVPIIMPRMMTVKAPPKYPGIRSLRELIRLVKSLGIDSKKTGIIFENPGKSTGSSKLLPSVEKK